jgi:hypothetical protein
MGRNFYGSGQGQFVSSCELNKGKFFLHKMRSIHRLGNLLAFQEGTCSLKLTYDSENFSKHIFWIRIKVVVICSVFSVSYGFVK